MTAKSDLRTLIYSEELPGWAVPQGSQPWWWPPGCQSCTHPPQSAARPLKGCWHGTEMGCWLPGSPLCGSHNRTGRTRHHHWAHNILGKNNIQSVKESSSSNNNDNNNFEVIPVLNLSLRFSISYEKEIKYLCVIWLKVKFHETVVWGNVTIFSHLCRIRN